MTRDRTSLTLALALGLGAAFLLWGDAAAQPAAGTPQALMGAALHQEEAEGNLEAAIALYQKVIAEHGADRALAARAQLHIGLCHERLGNAEARKAYERVLRDYVDQRDVAEQARARLAALGQPVSARTAMATRRVWEDFPLDNTGTFQGSASPDGRHIAFVDWKAGKIAVRDLSTGQTRSVTQTGGYAPEWGMFPVVSPDGKQVAYQWFPAEYFSSDVRVAGLDGSEPHVLLHADDEARWMQPVDWSPDGRQILVLGTMEPGQIALVSVADGGLRTLKTLDGRSPERVSFSPDGRHVAYDLPSPTGSRARDIFLLAADGSGEVPLVEHPANDSLLGWAPDGRTVLFTSDRTGKEGLWTVAVADGKPLGAPELLKPDLGPVHPLGFSRDGSFYYGVRTGIRDAYTAELDLATGKVISPPTPVAARFVGANMAPEWSLEGDSLAWVSNRGQGPNRLEADTLCIRSNATGEVREVSPKVSFLYRLRWYPGGRFLLVQAQRPEVGYYRVDTLSGEHTTVRLRLPKESSFKQPALSPDGKTLYFVHADPDAKDEAIRARDLETGQERVVCQPRSSWPMGLAVSPDGRHLAFHEGDEGGYYLTVAPVATGQARRVFRSPQRIQTLAWTPDGRRLLFGMDRLAGGAAEPATTELWLVPVEGGQPRKLDLAMDSLADLRMHPDGRHIAFVAGTHKGEVWVMENFLPRTKAAASR
jgi:Tol biopolymer transport system component